MRGSGLDQESGVQQEERGRTTDYGSIRVDGMAGQLHSNDENDAYRHQHRAVERHGCRFEDLARARVRSVRVMVLRAVVRRTRLVSRHSTGVGVERQRADVSENHQDRHSD